MPSLLYLTSIVSFTSQYYIDKNLPRGKFCLKEEARGFQIGEHTEIKLKVSNQFR